MPAAPTPTVMIKLAGEGEITVKFDMQLLDEIESACDAGTYGMYEEFSKYFARPTVLDGQVLSEQEIEDLFDHDRAKLKPTEEELQRATRTVRFGRVVKFVGACLDLDPEDVISNLPDGKVMEAFYALFLGFAEACGQLSGSPASPGKTTAVSGSPSETAVSED